MSTIIAQDSQTGTTATRVLTLTATPTAGKRLVLTATFSNTGTTSVVDSRGNTWTLDASQINAGTSTPTLASYAWSCQPSAALVAGDKITLTHSQTSGYALLALIEPTDYLGARDDGGGSGSGNGAGGIAMTVTVTPTGTADRLLALFAWGNTATATPQAPLTAVGSAISSAGTRSLQVFEATLSAAGTTNATATLGATGTWTGLGMAYPVVSAPSTAPAGTATGGGSYVHAWTGVPTATTGAVTTRTTAGAQVQLKVATDNALTQGVTYTSVQTADTAGYARHNLTGLAAGTTYYYDTIVGGTLAGRIGKLTTDVGTATFSVAFSADLASGSSSTTALDNARLKSPNLFLHLGNFHFDDTTGSSAAAYRGSLENQITGNLGLATLLRQVPTAYAPGDHDNGGNNVSAQPAANAAAASDAYRQVVPNTPVVTTAGTAGHYSSFTYGGVRFILLDTRSFRSANAATDDANKSMLGAAQKTWLKGELSRTQELLKVLCSDVPWLSTPALSNGGDNWGGYTTERSELASYITSNGVQALVLHGDSASLVGDDGSHSPGGLASFGAAPLDRPAALQGGPSWTSGPYPATSSMTQAADGTWTNGPQSQQYGLVTFTPGTSGGNATMTVAFNGYGADNASHVSVSRTYSAAGSAATAVTAPGNLSIVFDGNGFSPSGTDGVITATDLAATGGAILSTLDSAYPSAPVVQIASTPATSEATAISSGAGMQFTVTGTKPYTLGTLTFGIAKGGATDVRGVQVRTSGDGYAANLLATSAIPSVRPTLTQRSIDLSTLGTRTGATTIRFYAYTGTTNNTESIELDNITLPVAYSTQASGAATAGLAPDPFDGTFTGTWTTTDPAGGAAFALAGGQGTASITLPASPAHAQTVTGRTAARVTQPVAGAFDVAVQVRSAIAAPSAGSRQAGIGAWDSTGNKYVHFALTGAVSAATGLDFSYADSATTRTTFASSTWTGPDLVWLRLRWDGSAFEGFYSADADARTAAWTRLGAAKTAIAFTPATVGFFAGSTAASNSVTFGPFRFIGSTLNSGKALTYKLQLGGTLRQAQSLAYWNGSTTRPVTLGGFSAPDVACPDITSMGWSLVTDTTARLTVVTSEAVTAQLTYHTTDAAPPSYVTTSALATSTVLDLVNLTPASTHTTSLLVTDNDGDSTLVAPPSFTTTGGTTGGGTTGGTTGGGGITIVSGPTYTGTDTTESITFTTSAPSARRLDYKAQGAVAYTSNTRTTAPGTQHTIGLSGLSASTPYTGNLYLAPTDAELSAATPIPVSWTTQAPAPAPSSGGGTPSGGTTGGTPSGGTTGGTPSGGTTGGTTGSTGRPKLRFAPPAMSASATHWRPTASNRHYIGKPGEDIYVEPAGGLIDWNGGIEITGGHNIIIKGITWNYPKQFSDANASPDPGVTNRMMYFTGDPNNTGANGTRTIHIEGCAGVGQYIYEGINVDMKRNGSSEQNVTVQIQNHYIEHGVFVYATNGSHKGGDFLLQGWNGPYNIFMDRVTVNSTYQAFFGQATKYGTGPIGKRDFSNMNLRAVNDSTFLLTGDTNAQLTASNIYVKPGPKGFTNTVASGWRINGVTNGDVADYVTSKDYGPNYVSPGYI